MAVFFLKFPRSEGLPFIVVGCCGCGKRSVCRCRKMVEKGFVERCWREVLEQSVVRKCCGGVLSRSVLVLDKCKEKSVVEKCWRRVL